MQSVVKRGTARLLEAAAFAYRTAVRFAIINAQAANSRIFEIRNPSTTNLIVPLWLEVRWIQAGAHTAAILDSLDLFKVTSFTVVDTTNTVTPTVSKKRTAFPATSAVLRHVTVAGAAAGMTGGTLTKDANMLSSLSQWLLAAQPTAGTVLAQVKEMLEASPSLHPLVLGQDEGLILENRVLLGAAAASDVTVDFGFAEVPVN